MRRAAARAFCLCAGVRFVRVSASTALREREPSSEARWRFALRRASLASRRPLLRAERSRVACCLWDFFDGTAAVSFLTRDGVPDYYRESESPSHPAVSSTSQFVPSLPKVYDFFAPGGVLSRSSLPYEFRRGQLEMA